MRTAHALTHYAPLSRSLPAPCCAQAGSVGFPLFGAYSGSKWALEAMSDALRFEVRGRGALCAPSRTLAGPRPRWRRASQTKAQRAGRLRVPWRAMLAHC